MLHLHGLDGDDHGARGDLPSVGDPDRDDRSGHRADELGIAAVLVVGTHRGLAHFLDRHDTAVRRQPHLPAGFGDQVVGAQPVDDDGQQAGPSSDAAAASGVRRPRRWPSPRSGRPGEAHVVGALARPAVGWWSARVRRSASPTAPPMAGAPAAAARTATSGRQPRRSGRRRRLGRHEVRGAAIEQPGVEAAGATSGSASRKRRNSTLVVTPSTAMSASAASSSRSAPSRSSAWAMTLASIGS